jgi:hypothetical protein
MKKAELRRIIRESIKQLRLNEYKNCKTDKDCETGGPRARCIDGVCGHGDPKGKSTTHTKGKLNENPFFDAFMKAAYICCNKTGHPACCRALEGPDSTDGPEKTTPGGEFGGDDLNEYPDEGNAFGGAMQKAKEAGEDSFELDGKTYQVNENAPLNENVVCDTRNNNPYTGVSSTCPSVAGQGSQTCTANFPGDGYAGTCGPASIAPGTGGTPTGVGPVRGLDKGNMEFNGVWVNKADFDREISRTHMMGESFIREMIKKEFKK